MYQIWLLAVAINAFTQRYESFRTLQTFKNVIVYSMIQDVRTRWNSIFEMLKRAHLLRDTIEEWFTHTIVLKLQCLKLTTSEWKQIETIIEILRSFQQITDSLSFSSQLAIHTAWIVYNTMHAHLKNCSQKMKRERNKFLLNLRSTIDATQEKLKKYYEATSDKEDLYFNLELCLNSCDKLSYYKICYYSRAFSRSLFFFFFFYHILNIVALLVARSFFHILNIVALLVARSFSHILNIVALLIARCYCFSF